MRADMNVGWRSMAARKLSDAASFSARPSSVWPRTKYLRASDADIIAPLARYGDRVAKSPRCTRLRGSELLRRQSPPLARAWLTIPPADRDRRDAHRRDPLRHRHALAVLTARPAAFVDDQIVGHHVDLLEDLGPVADDVHVFDRPGQLAVLDEHPVLHIEGEVARADVDLAVGEVGAVDARLDRGDDLLGLVRPGEHVGRAH